MKYRCCPSLLVFVLVIRVVHILRNYIFRRSCNSSEFINENCRRENGRLVFLDIVYTSFFFTNSFPFKIRCSFADFLSFKISCSFADFLPFKIRCSFADFPLLKFTVPSLTSSGVSVEDEWPITFTLFRLYFFLCFLIFDLLRISSTVCFLNFDIL